MAKARLHPLFEHLRGTIKGMVFRLSHNGRISAYMSPDMSGVRWSTAQERQRERLAEASAYGKAAIADPEICAIYLQMSLEIKGNERPYDMAVMDYFRGNNLLGERFKWNVELWRAEREYRKSKRRRTGGGGRRMRHGAV